MRHADLCAYCERRIELFAGEWVDPEAGGEDIIWRETCDAVEWWPAIHEPIDTLMSEVSEFLEMSE